MLAPSYLINDTGSLEPGETSNEPQLFTSFSPLPADVDDVVASRMLLTHYFQNYTEQEEANYKLGDKITSYYAVINESGLTSPSQIKSIARKMETILPVNNGGGLIVQTSLLPVSGILYTWFEFNGWASGRVVNSWVTLL